MPNDNPWRSNSKAALQSNTIQSILPLLGACVLAGVLAKAFPDYCGWLFEPAASAAGALFLAIVYRFTLRPDKLTIKKGGSR